MSSYVEALKRWSTEGRHDRTPALVSAPIAATDSAPSEPFALLRDRLRMKENGKPNRVLVFAGCRGGEGASSVAWSFGASLAAERQRVLLIDADLRRQGPPRATGRAADLTRLVAEGLPPSASPSAGVEVVSGITRPSDLDRFLRSDRLATWIAAQRNRYDWILIDTPAALAQADAALLGRIADGVVLVVRANRTVKKDLARAGQQLARSGCKTLGIVLNGVEPLPPALRLFATEGK